MNVLYLISTFEKGVGGHYFSLKTTVDNLIPDINPILLNVGIAESPIIRESGYFNYHINYNFFNLNHTLKTINEIIVKHDIDLLHCFDDRAYFFTRFLKVKNKPVLLTKCGGPNPKYYPKTNDLVLFSLEDYKFFERRFLETKLHFIPNRVGQFELSKEKEFELRSIFDIDTEAVSFLRITRIAEFYLESLKQSIQLVEDLIAEGIKAQLFIIGNVIDQYIVDDYLSDKSYIFFTSDRKFTSDAKSLIGICDFYIGTGRGLMEASQKERIILTPVKNRKYPALVQQDSFMIFFETNFSERNQIAQSNDEIFKSIVDVIKDENNKNDLKQFYSDKFDQYFNIASVREKYLSIYNSLIPKNKSFLSIDFLKHFLIYHYYFITHKFPFVRKMMPF